MSFDDPGDVRFRPDDGCPLFSESLEDHIVAVARGGAPNAGRFCGRCYTPISRDTARCPHCAEPCTGTGSATGDDTGRTGRAPVEAVPQAIIDALMVQRRVEANWVNGFAYLGLLLAVISGLAIVLGVPFFRSSLLWATLFYAPYLLIGSRVFAAILGGYYGDRIGYEKARARTRAAWTEWEQQRDADQASTSKASRS
ncbi:MAG: zinc ribbon domain-containing protein [Dehalococcoidia bacterium]